MKRFSAIFIVAVAVDLADSAAGRAAPDVNNDEGATSIVAGSARLRGTLTGGGPADVCVYWGPTDGGTAPEAWDHKIELKGVKNGEAFSIAAMKYMVIICKRHDGFSMFDTKLRACEVLCRCAA